MTTEDENICSRLTFPGIPTLLCFHRLGNCFWSWSQKNLLLTCSKETFRYSPDSFPPWENNPKPSPSPPVSSPSFTLPQSLSQLCPFSCPSLKTKEPCNNDCICTSYTELCITSLKTEATLNKQKEGGVKSLSRVEWFALDHPFLSVHLSTFSTFHLSFCIFKAQGMGTAQLNRNNNFLKCPSAAPQTRKHTGNLNTTGLGGQASTCCSTGRIMRKHRAFQPAFHICKTWKEHVTSYTSRTITGGFPLSF